VQPMVIGDNRLHAKHGANLLALRDGHVGIHGKENGAAPRESKLHHEIACGIRQADADKVPWANTRVSDIRGCVGDSLIELAIGQCELAIDDRRMIRLAVSVDFENRGEIHEGTVRIGKCGNRETLSAVEAALDHVHDLLCRGGRAQDDHASKSARRDIDIICAEGAP
jgi:hypothetical protein